MKAFNFYPACGLHSYEGYGRAEIGLVKGFYEIGIEYHLYPDPSLATLFMGNPKWAASPFMEYQRKWIYTMIESTQASDRWVKPINEYCERVIVPAPDMVKLMQDSGIEKPIHFIPLGVDAFTMPNKKRVWECEEQFVFLTYSYGDMRKGADLAIVAFKALFEGDKRFKLIVKARDFSDVQWLKAIESEQIEVIRGKLSEQAWRTVLDNAHAFIFPSRAEGFGLPPREAVLSGLPTIATQWLGMWDVESWGYPLAVSAMRPAQYMEEINNRVGALWSEPCFDDLLKWMQYIVDHYQESSDKAQSGREYLLKNFSWRDTALQIEHLIRQYG